MSFAPLLALAGLVAASNATRERDACRRLLLRMVSDSAVVWARLGEPPNGSFGRTSSGRASSGTVSSVHAVLSERSERPRCRVPGWLKFAAPGKASDTHDLRPEPAGNVRAGLMVAITGTAMPTSRGLRVEQVRLHETAGHDRLVAWRADIGRTIDTLFRSRAPLVRALLIADQDGIPVELRDRYADAGLVHMLSVSGMHVAIIASALLAFGGLLRLPRATLEPVSLVIVALYVALLGFPAPAVRSAVMLGVVAIAAQLQRPVHEWTALALGAVVPTIDPLIVTDLGWQLSVGGMAALVAARALRRRWRRWAMRLRPERRSPPSHGRAYDHAHDRSHHHSHHREGIARRLSASITNAAAWLGRRRGIGGWFVQEIFTGVVATVVTAPVIAWTFGRLSLIAPLSNLPGGAIIALLQPALFLALLVTPIPGAAAFVADATQPLMALLDGLAAFTAAVPGAVLPVTPSLTTVMGAGMAAACFVRGSASPRATRWWLGGASALVASLWLSLLRGGSGTLEMHVLDVGQGDAIALRTPRGRWVVVDAGPRWQGGDAARRVIIPWLRRRGGDVALFVLSHAHDDHAGGAATFVRALRPTLWWEPAFVTTSPGYRDALEAVAESGTRWERARPGAVLHLDGVTFTVLAPDSAWTAAQHDANETSVVLRVDYGAHRFLLTGDAEREEETWIGTRWPPEMLRADVLKVGHHGSRTSSSAAFLDAVMPRLAVVSLGAGNRYGHPATETVEAFLERGVPLLRTDHEGTVIVRSNGRTLEVESGDERWTLPSLEPLPRVHALAGACGAGRAYGDCQPSFVP